MSEKTSVLTFPQANLLNYKQYWHKRLHGCHAQEVRQEVQSGSWLRLCDVKAGRKLEISLAGTSLAQARRYGCGHPSRLCKDRDE